MTEHHTVAYFSMEIGLDPAMPTYSGGLGVLAGDSVRSAADLKLPLVAVTLLPRDGYFYQRIDRSGWQTEEPAQWVIEDYLKETPARASVTIENRVVQIRAWRYEIVGQGGATVPVYFLDTDLPENTEWDRSLTRLLYGGDSHYRLCQEVVLGIGGVRMLTALGYDGLGRFHMNEGHASFLALELLEVHARQAGRASPNHDDVEAVRRKCVFTTHTPVPAGHDKFPLDMVAQVLGDRDAFRMKEVFCCEGLLNMTYLALNLSHYVNGVAKKHGEVSQSMFARYSIDSITNGIHLATWTSEPFQSLFDLHIPGWRHDNFSLRYALNIPKTEVWRAHTTAKHSLIHYINREVNAGLDVDVLTLGFARRAASYKRADMLFDDIERLRAISTNDGPIQIVYAGKAHPRDEEGKRLIQRLHQLKERVRPDVRVAYLANYDMALGRMLTAGVDVWLNTPEPPLEASGTSGMKAAVNG
ncbi:MAG: alpha-glucan family phosphorylase, partial [Bdellovibrionales bacterium]|nr:alpha-glucan family phosphorylase [Bdellovibrionales bacterium]